MPAPEGSQQKFLSAPSGSAVRALRRVLGRGPVDSPSANTGKKESRSPPPGLDRSPGDDLALGRHDSAPSGVAYITRRPVAQEALSTGSLLGRDIRARIARNRLCGIPEICLNLSINPVLLRRNQVLFLNQQTTAKETRSGRWRPRGARFRQAARARRRSPARRWKASRDSRIA